MILSTAGSGLLLAFLVFQLYRDAALAALAAAICVTFADILLYRGWLGYRDPLLAMLVFGMYGELLPNQNGAPLRLALPWKYGFKSAKSIVKIRLVEKEPVSSWTKAAQQEYGFYSNVNPNVPHPRWSQATERRIGEDGLFAKRRATLMFNGYEAQVGQLYAGMDLKKFY